MDHNYLLNVWGMNLLYFLSTLLFGPEGWWGFAEVWLSNKTRELFRSVACRAVQISSGSNWRCKLFLGAVPSGSWEGIFCVGTMDNSCLSITDNYATKDTVSLIDGKGKITPSDTIPCSSGLIFVWCIFSVGDTMWRHVKFISGSCKFHIRKSSKVN